MFGSPKRVRSEGTPDTSPPANAEVKEVVSKPKPCPRPRPRAKARGQVPQESEASPPAADAPSPGVFPQSHGPSSRVQSPPMDTSDDDMVVSESMKGGGKRKPVRIVISDEED